ncbi:MAG: hypothetical protein OEY41_11995 [Acidimicrobiia bacterium]|nr:hypothetical protein [Acidimicrobiia bacterium]
MAITEQQRHQLFQQLEELLGSEEATTLMEHLPPVGWADVATKSDLDHHQDLTRAHLDRTSVGLGQEITQVRTDLGAEISHVRADLKAEISHVRADLDAKITQVRTDLELTMERGFREQTRVMVLTNVGSMIAFASVLLTALRL